MYVLILVTHDHSLQESLNGSVELYRSLKDDPCFGGLAQMIIHESAFVLPLWV